MLQSLPPAADASAALRDIHLPPPPPWWPPAPGWWLLGAVLLGVLAWTGLRVQKRWRRGRRIDSILLQFDRDTGASNDAASSLLAASAILRRAARLRHPDASQREGEAWLQFLDGDDPAQPFSTGNGRLLVDGAFRPTLDADSARSALTAARTRLRVLLEAAHA